jgi:hypothetical protein
MSLPIKKPEIEKSYSIQQLEESGLILGPGASEDLGHD